MKICYFELMVYWINGGNLGCGVVWCVGVLVCWYFINCFDCWIVVVILSCGLCVFRIGIYLELNFLILMNCCWWNINCSLIVVSWKMVVWCLWVWYCRVGLLIVCCYCCVSIEILGFVMCCWVFEVLVELVIELCWWWEGGSWVLFGCKGLLLWLFVWEVCYCGLVDLRYIIFNLKLNFMWRILINDLKLLLLLWCY